MSALSSVCSQACVITQSGGGERSTFWLLKLPEITFSAPPCQEMCDHPNRSINWHMGVSLRQLKTTDSEYNYDCFRLIPSPYVLTFTHFPS